HADKPRVYQGVRVKTTVKELLQRHRARKANSKQVKTIPQACVDVQDLYAPTFQKNIRTLYMIDSLRGCSAFFIYLFYYYYFCFNHIYIFSLCIITLGNYGDATTTDCCAQLFQLRNSQFPAAASAFSIQLQESAFSAPLQQMQQQSQQQQQQQQPFEIFPENFYNNINTDSSCSINSMHPSPAFLPPLSQGLDVDYYDQGMGPCSSPESLKLCSPVDQNSYSPQESFSSSSSSCYDSPTRMESSFSNFTSEHFHYQNCNPHHCYCLSHYCPSQQEYYAAPEYSAYYAPSEYSYSCTVEENYLKNNFAMNTEMCYNVL
ncbi:colorectal cancer associated 2, partial [Synchiropus splendidus]|uniref:colorectal cancer associated 2 n=1 Tax=Synchiropus splendidus TaxID=270530 RepID=UPI00237E033C